MNGSIITLTIKDQYGHTIGSLMTNYFDLRDNAYVGYLVQIDDPGVEWPTQFLRINMTLETQNDT